MLSLTRIMASARRRAWSVGLRKMKNVRRWAVFTPTPGSFENSSISAATGAAMLLILQQSWNFHSAKHLLLRITHLSKGILSSRQDHHFQFGDVFGIKGFRVNFDSGDFKLPSHGDCHCTTTSSTDKLACLQLFLRFYDFLL